MKGRVVLGFVAVAILGVTGFWWSREDAAPTKVAAEAPKAAPTAPEAKVEVRRPAPIERTAAPEPTPAAAATEEARPARPRVDEAKVARALARLERVASKFTEEELKAEQDSMNKRLEEFNAIETPDPVLAQLEDTDGMGWVSLTYPSGEVRYELPE
jgi:predicted negative regulator of RcsB-dependent stress response